MQLALDTEIPYGYCHCGCGERTRRAEYTDRSKGWVKGEPIRYLNNRHYFDRYRDLRPAPPNPSGRCMCGCGEKAPIALDTNRKYGWVAGEPKRFIQGHSVRLKALSLVEYVVNDLTGCWIWQRARNKKGYGLKHCSERKCHRSAHVMYWERDNGPVPEGMQLDHLCVNPRCVNPEHLEVVTPAENRRRSSSAIRERSADAV